MNTCTRGTVMGRTLTFLVSALLIPFARAWAGYEPADGHWAGFSGDTWETARADYCSTAAGIAPRGRVVYHHPRGCRVVDVDVAGRGSEGTTGMVEAAVDSPLAHRLSSECCVCEGGARYRGSTARSDLRAGWFGGEGSLPAHIASPADLGLPRSGKRHWRDGTSAVRRDQQAQKSSISAQGSPAWTRNRAASCPARFGPHAGANVDAAGHNESREGSLRVRRRRNPGDDATNCDSPFHSPNDPTLFLASARRPANAVRTGDATLFPEVASPRMEMKGNGEGRSRRVDRWGWVRVEGRGRDDSQKGARRSCNTFGRCRQNGNHTRQDGEKQNGRAMGGHGRRGRSDNNGGVKRGCGASHLRITTAEMPLSCPALHLHRAAADDAVVSSPTTQTRDPPDADAPPPRRPPSRGHDACCACERRWRTGGGRG